MFYFFSINKSDKNLSISFFARIKLNSSDDKASNSQKLETVEYLLLSDALMHLDALYRPVICLGGVTWLVDRAASDSVKQADVFIGVEALVISQYVLYARIYT